MQPEEFRNIATILGVKINDISLDETMDKIADFLNSDSSKKIYTPNPEICLKAEKDEYYRQILNDSDINIPDGFGLKLGAKILKETLNNRVTGADLTKNILEKYKNSNYKIGIILRTDSLSKPTDIKNLFAEKYPKLQFTFTSIDRNNYLNCDQSLNKLLEFQPQILFVCLGAPMQEIWINKFLKILPSIKIALGVGGSFDFLTGKMNRAPEIIRKLGMEWFYRLYKEPKRLGRIKNATADFLLKCHEWNKRIATTLRPNVLGIIKNREGLYLIQKNPRLKDHWQFPQGGIALNEDPESAVVREASEELGIHPDLLFVIRKFPETHEYTWPRYAQLLRGYKGQRQAAFLLDFKGTDNDIHPGESDEVEDFKWVEKKDLINSLNPIRRSYAEKLIKYL